MYELKIYVWILLLVIMVMFNLLSFWYFEIEHCHYHELCFIYCNSVPLFFITKAWECSKECTSKVLLKIKCVFVELVVIFLHLFNMWFYQSYKRWLFDIFVDLGAKNVFSFFSNANETDPEKLEKICFSGQKLFFNHFVPFSMVSCLHPFLPV